MTFCDLIKIAKFEIKTDKFFVTHTFLPSNSNASKIKINLNLRKSFIHYNINRIFRLFWLGEMIFKMRLLLFVPLKDMIV
jgi:hypothetical protein